MDRKIESEFEVGDCLVRYVLESSTRRIGIELVPASLKSQIAIRRSGLGSLPEIAAIPGAGDPPACRVHPLVHVKIVVDPYSGSFAQGRTMLFSPSNDRFRFLDQSHQRDGERQVVTTRLKADNECVIEHQLSWHGGEQAFTTSATFTNGSPLPVTLEMFSSFALGGITPFDSADATEQLRIHRFRSVWSAEGRLDTQTVEQLHLERSWINAGLFSERFGQVGSMPVRGWFPFLAAEDVVRGVSWGAQLAWAGSWQMEVSRQHDEVGISGGLADREFGHWHKTIAPGESFTTPSATIACVHGDLDALCDRLTAVQQCPADQQPKVEHDLPIVFNEWCTSWGDPSHEKVASIAQRLEGSPVRYLVIDAGWYKPENGKWDSAHGDWIPSAKLFPDGLERTATAIRERGLVPGIWFEMETCGSNSTAFSVVDRLLQRDGIPITVSNRRFWDLNNPNAINYLSERVIDLLERCGFGYLKVDYNETIGIGSANAESLGEGLRQQIEGVYRLFDRIRARLPDLVIENCSSGGHRLEPSMIGRTAMSSFSDAHELVEIPIIACNLHRLMLPRQSQIWAVLHKSDSDRRLIYSLAATFLGRMCLSGEIDQLSADQWDRVLQAQSLYQRVADIIKRGTSRRFGDVGLSWRHPRGWQGVLRIADDRSRAIAVIHTFRGGGGDLRVPLPADLSGCQVVETFATVPLAAKVDGQSLQVTLNSDFDAAVLLLESVSHPITPRATPVQ